MTDQLAPIDDATQYRRKIDDSLARFSAAHDELAAEEAQKKQRIGRLLETTKTRLTRVVAAPAGTHTGDADEEPARRRPSVPEPVAAATASAAAGDEPADTEDDEPQRTRLQEKKHQREQRTTRAARIGAIAAAILVFLATGTAWGMKTWFNGKFNEIAALDENSSDIQNAAGQRGDENFLIAGSDTREGAAAEEGVGNSDQSPGARSDSLMIAHVPADRKRAVVVSFPRDLEVSLPECERWDAATGKYTGEKLPARDRAKVNEAFAFGGPRCTTKLVQQLTGIKINHFVGIDFHGFKGMIDAVGGVPIHLDKPLIDAELGTVVPTAGDHNISGDQALNFVRARKVRGDPTSDYGRIKRQQQVISSLLTKTMSSDVLFNIGKLTGLVNAFAGATFGENIGVDQLLTLAKSMQGLDPATVKFLTVPTVGEANSRGNEVMLQEKAAALFRSLIDNTPLPAEDAATTAGQPAGPNGPAPEPRR